MVYRDSGGAAGGRVAIGLLQGLIVTLFRVQSFIVTLAGLLAWNGVVLHEIGQEWYGHHSEHRRQRGRFQVRIFRRTASRGVGARRARQWIWHTQSCKSRGHNSRHPQGEPEGAPEQIRDHRRTESWGCQSSQPSSSSRSATRIAVSGCGHDHNLLIALVALHVDLARSTPFGRYVYAVGGNAEAARRAGISVDAHIYRVIVFVISSTFRAGPGREIILASRLRSVDTDAGGGKSSARLHRLGGDRRHRVCSVGAASSPAPSSARWSSPPASITVWACSTWRPATKFIITGIVLLIAVIVDSLATKGRASSGRA